jgi:hypothetical protein
MRSYLTVSLLSAACVFGAVSLWPDQTAKSASSEVADCASARALIHAARFVPNRGQWDPEVAFGVLGNTSGWLHRDGFTVRLERRAWQGVKGSPDGPSVQQGQAEVTGCVVRTRFSGQGARSIEAGEPLAGEYNFLLGADPEAWQTHVPAFASVRMRDVNPGIDVQYRPLSDGVVGPFEYDLLLAPGADLAAFSARCEGARSLRIDGAGQLRVLVATPDGEIELVQQAPVAWQDGPRGRQPLHVAFRLLGEDGYGFVAAELDPTCAATVDPGVVWSTYLGGGSSDSINDFVWQPGVGIWVAGWAGSMDFPTTPGAYRTTGQQDGFVARLDENGSTLVYGTYLGGGLGDEIRGIGLAQGLQPTVVGFTRSYDFPVTAGAYQPYYAGGSLVVDVGDAFVARLSAAGDSLLGATYLGGMFDDVAEAVAVDAAGYACVAGWTSSGNFPTTPGSWQPALGGPLTLQTDGFLARISPDCRTAAYSTYVGGQLPDQLTALALDRSTGEVIATGWTSSSNFPVTGSAYRTTSGGGIDMVIVRLNATGSNAVFSTYLGSADGDIANCVAIAADGSVWGGGYTNSTNFPTTIGAPQRVPGGGDDGVVFHLSANGSTLLFSTLFGGPGAEQVRGVAVDGSDVMAVGETSGGIPVTSQAFQPLFGGGSFDGFITRYTSSGAVLDLSTYYGGSYPDVLDHVVLANSGLAVISGWSFATDFPVTVGALQTQLRGSEDGVLLKLDLLTDLGGGLLVGGGNGGGAQRIGAGAHDVLSLVASNQTTRELRIDAVRLLITGGAGLPALLDSVRVFVDDPNLPPENDPLAAGPLPVSVVDRELDIPLQGVRVPAAGAVTLRVVFDVHDPVSGEAVDVSCAVVDASAWTLSAPGFGTGPTVRVIGTGRAEGAALVVGALPGDADGDGVLTVYDLRKQCVRLGQNDRSIDTDGDGVLTTNDVDFTRAALLGRPTVVHWPAVIARGEWFAVQGLFPVTGIVDATLGGRSLTVGRLLPREFALRADASQLLGLQDLHISVDGVEVLVRTVLVQ